MQDPNPYLCFIRRNITTVISHAHSKEVLPESTGPRRSKTLECSSSSSNPAQNPKTQAAKRAKKPRRKSAAYIQPSEKRIRVGRASAAAKETPVRAVSAIYFYPWLLPRGTSFASIARSFHAVAICIDKKLNRLHKLVAENTSYV